MNRDEIKFWLLFFILNSFIFLPGYLLDSGKSTFIPYEGFLNGPVPGRFNVLFDRENSDIFRLSIDLLAFTCAFHLLRKRIQINLVVLFLFLFYLFIFLYQIYHQSIEKIYHVPPLLNNDIHLIVMSFSIFFSDLSPRSLLVLTGIITLLSVIFFLIRSFLFCLTASRFGAPSRVIFITLATLTVISTGTYGIESKSSHVFQLHTLGIIENIKASYHAKKTLGSFDAEKFLASNNYNKYALKERPNVYLLFIESYGRILLDNPDLFRDYKEYAGKNEIRLRKNGWQSSSHLSRSPVSGGKSWISYATVLYGYNFKNRENNWATYSL